MDTDVDGVGAEGGKHCCQLTDHEDTRRDADDPLTLNKHKNEHHNSAHTRLWLRYIWEIGDFT